MNTFTAAAIIPAAGSGRRLGGQPKQFRALSGVPVLIHSARAVLAHPAVRSLCVAAPAGYEEATDSMLRSAGLPDVDIHVVVGGATRQVSVSAALQATPQSADLVLVHDAARPFLSRDLLQTVLEAAAQAGAAALAIPVSDTLRSAVEGEFADTIDRAGAWAMQTPQAARRALMRAAFDAAERDGFDGTDEVALLQRAGVAVRLVEGDPRNLKLTTEADWVMAQALVKVISDW